MMTAICAVTWSAIADDLVFQAGQEVTEKEIEEVLSIIQDFDPAGVGARDLQECLLLQLGRREKHLIRSWLPGC